MTIYCGREVTSFAQDDTGVEVKSGEETTVWQRY
jgi:hypothetical protein